MSFRDEVLNLLYSVAEETMGASRAALSENTRFKEDLSCKSVDIVRFTVALEDEYEAEVPFMAFNRIKTFAEAADYMCDLMGMS